MSQHADAVRWARSHVGEHEQPMGSNRGPFVQQVQRETWLGGTGWPWCQAFANACWTLGAKRKLPYRGAGSYAFLDWHRRNTDWVVPIQQARPGAFCIWNTGAGHTSILRYPYSRTAPQVETIDGNVSDQVRICRRPVGLLRGVVDPPEPVRKPVKQAKAPVYEVVSSVNGHKKVVYASGVQAISRRLHRLLRRHGQVTIRRRRKT